MPKNAEGVPGADGNAARVWQRGATRRTILDAARLIAAREGVEAFSLNTVARETGLSTTTIFAYYANKNDLFAAVLADDLATLARTMRESYDFSTPPEPSANEPVVEDQPEQSQSTPTATIVPMTRVAEDTSPDGAPRPENPPRVDAWLERRLRVFEKSLADVETRLSAAQLDSTAAKSIVEESTRIFGARLDASEKRAADLSNDLTTRMAATETRLRDASTDLKSRLLDACTRIDMLEAAARHAVSDVRYASLPTEPIFVPQAADEPKKETAETIKPSVDSYLSAARRAAKAAAELSEIETSDQKAKKAGGWSGHARLAIGTGIVGLFVAGATVAYAIGHHDGLSRPIRVVVPYSASTAHRHFASLPAITLTSLDKLSARASAGDRNAELAIGLKYYRGEGIAVNLPEAAKWVGRAARANDAVAQFWMGEIYSRGDGVSADAAQALHWYELSAAQGNRQAMHDSGMAYAQGLGTQKDYTQAANWFSKAAALGLVNSQFNLAVLYERGEGVPQNFVEAYKWYAVAAQSGDFESRARVDALATAMTASDISRAQGEAATFKPQTLNRDANAAPPSLPPSRA